MTASKALAVPAARRLSYATIRVGFTGLAVLFVVIWNIPVIMTVLISFKSASEVLSNPFGLPSHPSLTAFEQAWKIMSYGQLLINSVLYATFGSLLAILLALVPAYVFSSLKFPGKALIFVALLTTLMLPQQTVIIPLFDLLQSLNLLNTRQGLIIVHGVYGMSFQLLILTGFMASIPRELFAAARIDGCTDLGILRHIVIPLTIPAMAVGFTINFIDIWKEYFFALVFLSSDTVMPINIGIQTLTNPQYMTSMNLPAAAVVLAQLPIIVLFIFAYRAITQGLYTGSVKG